MSTCKALQYFRKDPYRYNCAQSICAACGRNDLLEATSNCGTGKAPDGLCGALYAALLILPDNQSQDVIEQFKKANGAIHCIQLKKECKVPCQQCLEVAERIVNEKLV